jgi:YceI-like domain
MTMKSLFSFLFLCGLSSAVFAQQYFTRDAIVRFDATAANSPETIQAVSKSNSCVLTNEGNVEMAVLIKNFQFERALMQEHFNENYMESTKYPKAVFKGKIDNMSAVKLDKDGTYKANVSGIMTIHGVNKNITTPVDLVVKGDKISAKLAFSVQLADYKITIPNLVADKVGKTANIKLEAELVPLKK